MFRNKLLFSLLLVLVLMAVPSIEVGAHAASVAASGPYAQRCETLVNPMGVDAEHPMLSWKLRDGARGAGQTSYEVTVFSRRPQGDAKPDVWDSGRVRSNRSIAVPYAGQPLTPSTRYFWRVRLWDKDGKPYPVSAINWWETGLMGQAWDAKWIGYESRELHTIRTSTTGWITNVADLPEYPGDTQHAFRYAFTLEKPVGHAVLYATGEDTVSAWIDGTQVMQSLPLLPSKQMPWGKYVRQDVTSAVVAGQNLLAIDVTRYLLPGQNKTPARTPMSACLYITFADGSTSLISTASDGWRAILNPVGNWWVRGFNDTSWKATQAFIREDKLGPDTYGSPWPTGPVVALRHTFTEDKSIVSARLYATALGAYMIRLNGTPVGEDVLAPGWMDFRQHVAYQTYDVTQQLKQGRNAIAAYLAPGWYTTPLRWTQEGNNYGTTQPTLKAQLRIEHGDGSVEWVRTDDTWKASPSLILKAEIYDGETIDATQRIDGWDTAGFEDASWASVAVVTPIEPKLESEYYPPIKAHRVLTATSITNPETGVYIVDFGQNMSAVPRLSVSGKRGDTITLRFAEVLNPDGTLYVDNLRTAKATDTFILNGPGGKGADEEFQPLFTYHGFRYAEIRGLRSAPTSATLKAVVLHSDMLVTSRLSTGEPMVNKLWNNILWGQRSNFLSVPTDCPQRDERLGWSADAQVFWRTASYNMDLSTFSRKFAADLRGTQVGTPMYGIYAPGIDVANPGFGAAWSDAGVIIPWTGWIQSGDPRIIDENWEGMQRYLTEIESKNPNHLWRVGTGSAFGDWLTPTITTPEDLLATAYWAYDVSLMHDMALATGRTQDASRYARLFEDIRAAFQKAYIRGDGFVGATNAFPSLEPPTVHPQEGTMDKDRLIETQTGYVLALYMKLMPDDLREKAAQRLASMIQQNHGLIGTGFLGTPYLLEVLADTGHSDLAYSLLLNREYPSWGYLIDHGATTTWERWNGDKMLGDPAMNSYNHYAYGAIGEWLYRYAAGVDTRLDAPGFQSIYLHPHFDRRLGSIHYEYDSPYGAILSDWKMEADRIAWKVTVPANATADFAVADTNGTDFRLEGTSLEKVGTLVRSAHGGYVLPAGTYHFTALSSNAH
jgi:alpha-L-rhamnosidase